MFQKIKLPDFKLPSVLQHVKLPSFLQRIKFPRSGAATESDPQSSYGGDAAPKPLPVLGRLQTKNQYRLVIGATVLVLAGIPVALRVSGDLNARLDRIRSQVAQLAQSVEQLRGEVQGAAVGNTDSAEDIDRHYLEIMQRVADLSVYAHLKEVRVTALPAPQITPEWTDKVWNRLVGNELDLTDRLERVLQVLDDFSKVVSVQPQFGGLAVGVQELLRSSDRAVAIAKQARDAREGVSDSLVDAAQELKDATTRFSNSGGNTVDLAGMQAALIGLEREIDSQSGRQSTYKGQLQDLVSGTLQPTMEVVKEGFNRLAQDLSLEFSRASDATDKTLVATNRSLDTPSGIRVINGIAPALLILGVLGLAILAAINAKASAFAAYYAKKERDETDERVLDIMRELSPVANGDLTKSLTVTDHVTGSIADRVNLTVDQLREVLNVVKGSTREVESAIEDVMMQTAEASDLTERANMQAAASKQASERGAEAVALAVERANAQRAKIQEVSKAVKRLGEVFQSVNRVSDAIEDITSVSEVLALNTALQASTAGEEGAGFRVIASEQQRLTEDTKKSLENIKLMMASVLAETQTVIQTVETVTAEMVESSHVWDEAGQSLQSIREASAQLAALMADVEKTAQVQNEAASNAVAVMGKLSESTYRFKTADGDLVAA